MGLPRVIEFLLTLREPGGGNLVHQGANQTLIPAVPPNTEFVLQAFPIGSDYIDIAYGGFVDPMVVPGAFYGYGQYFGNRTYDGVITAGFIAYNVESFVLISESEPAIALLRNLTALNQYYSGMIYFITIDSERSYNLVLEALNKMGSSAKSEQLATEANQLLRQIVTGAPEPPIGGTF